MPGPSSSRRSALTVPLDCQRLGTAEPSSDTNIFSDHFHMSNHHEDLTLSKTLHPSTGGGSLLPNRPSCSRRLFTSESKATSESGHPLNVSLHSSQLDSSYKQHSSPTSDRLDSPASTDTNSEKGLLSIPVSSLSASVTTPESNMDKGIRVATQT